MSDASVYALRRFSSDLERVDERIGTSGLAGDPAGGAQCAVGEGGAALGAMAEFQALADACEEHRVLAHDVPGPHHRETDAARLAYAAPVGAGHRCRAAACLAHDL